MPNNIGLDIDPVKSGQLLINDIIFDIPPQNIQIIKRDQNLNIPTLRTTHATKIKSGRKEVIFIIDLVYATGYKYSDKVEQKTVVGMINTQLAPLIIQTRKCPFCTIENEKIRNEMAGELGEDSKYLDQENYKQMAGCIESIRITTNLNSPEFLNVQLVIKWLNYSAYSTYFRYLHNLGTKPIIETPQDIEELFSPKNNQIIPIKDPRLSQYYQAFYKNGTYRNGEFINEIENFDNDIEIFYREYKDLDSAYGPHPEKIDEWTLLSSSIVLGRDVYYKYNSFKVSDSKLRDESGKLVPLNFEVVLKTNTPSLPLLGHTTPVTQFLGVSDASITISLFANAEIQNGEPISSSHKLSELSNVLEKINLNSIAYRPIAKKDPIYIKSSILKLLQYELYDDNFNDLIYLNEIGKISTIEKDLLVPVVVNGLNTSTIPESPFCNKIDIELTESYKNKESDKLKNQGMGRDIFETLRDNLIIAAGKFDIRYDQQKNKFVSEQTSIRNKFLEFSKTPIKRVNDIGLPLKINLIISTLKLINKQLKYNPKERDYKTLIKDAFENDKLVEVIENTTNKLVKFALELKPDYLNKLGEELSTFNTTDPDSTYPDMKLPINPYNGSRRKDVGVNPDFYFENDSDNTFPKLQKKIVPLAVDSLGKSMKSLYNANLSLHKDPEKLKKGYLPFLNPPIIAGNTAYDKGKESNPNSKNLVHQFDLEGQSLVLSSAISSLKDKTYTVRRVMPTFKLYFLSDATPTDKGERRNVWLNFDDFYNINSIEELRWIKDKNLAADTLIIKMTNVNRDLTNEDFPTIKKDGRRIYSYGNIDGKKVGERIELPKKIEKFDNLMLNEGTKIQLRVGSEADPDKLTIEFNGRISQISGSDVLEIVCQSHAVELQQETKGVIPSTSIFAESTYSYNAETNDLIGHLLFNSKEILSFGHRGRSRILGPSEFGGRYTFADWSGGTSLTDNIIAPPVGWSFTNVLIDKFTTLLKINYILGAVATASVPFTGPVGPAVIGAISLPVDIAYTLYAAWDLIKQSAIFSPFYIYQQTVWDVLKELELRHPDCICRAEPYDTRMTLFFGHPDQFFFYRGPHLIDSLDAPTNFLGMQETLAASRNRLAESFREDYTDVALNALSPDKGGQLTYDSSELTNRLNKRQIEENPVAATEFDKMKNYVKIFRNYHMITSEHDIIMNNIRADSKDTYNAISILYPEDGADSNLDGSVGFGDYEQYDTIKADDDLHPNFIRTGTFAYHNARKWGNVDLTRMYALSLLKRSLEKTYKGELVILGREGIKPYDIVCLFDRYSNIFGAFEVERVVQTMSYKTGWVTEITPNLIIYVNNISGRSQLEAISNIFATTYVINEEKFLESNFNLNKGILPPLSTEIDPLLVKDIVKTPVFFAKWDFILRSPGILKDKWKATSPIAIKELASTVKGSNIKNLTDIKNLALDLKKTPFLTKGAGEFFGSVTGRALGIAAFFGLDYFIDNIVSYGKNRQPIIICPLKRDGRPWTLGLYGFDPDDTFESIKLDVTDKLHEFKVGTMQFINAFLGDNLTL